MKKDYNYWVTPHNTPRFKLKRLLHILSSSCLVVNLVVFAILLPDVRLWTLGLTFVFIAYTLLQLFDKRRSEWNLWGIIFDVFISIAVSLCYILLFNLYLYFIVITTQIIISIIIFCILTKK